MLNKEKLETLLKSRWTEWLNHNQLMKQVLIDTRNASLQKIENPQEKTSMTIMISSIILKNDEIPYLEIHTDFRVPREDGMAIGFHVYQLFFSGEIQLIETYGTLFK